jgi:hypothetical protein
VIDFNNSNSDIELNIQDDFFDDLLKIFSIINLRRASSQRAAKRRRGRI